MIGSDRLVSDDEARESGSPVQELVQRLTCGLGVYLIGSVIEDCRLADVTGGVHAAGRDERGHGHDGDEDATPLHAASVSIQPGGSFPGRGSFKCRCQSR